MMTEIMTSRTHRGRQIASIVCVLLGLSMVSSNQTCVQAIVAEQQQTIEGRLVAPAAEPTPALAKPRTSPQPTPAKREGSPSKVGSQAASLSRLTSDIRYLASAELAGRQPGTPEMQLAEDFIIQQYRDAKVLGGSKNGTYRQLVPVDGTRTIDPSETRMAFHGPDDLQLTPVLNEAFTVLVGRKPNSIKADLVFVGYGIAADEHNYNEYRDIDVKGKVVVMIRREPQQKMSNSVFDGEETSGHSFIVSKVRAARKAGATGIILINDAETAPTVDDDKLVQSNQFGTISFPFYQIKRSVFNEILAVSPLHAPTGSKLGSLEKIEAWIDARLEPISQPMKGWSVEARASFPKTDIVTSNLVAVVPGSGDLADETVIVGAHYDHLGLGAYGSRTPWRKEIHYGADDNATGTAAVLELARRFGSRKAGAAPRRRLVLICFTAEEMGLLGALHYVAKPLFKLDDTVAMVNFDMIGLLRQDELTIYNWNTSPAFASILDTANNSLGLSLKLPAAGFAGSDHLPFNQSKIPNMFIHTGISDTYHTPDDTFETINCEGVLKVVDFSDSVLEQLLTSPRPAYGTPKRFRLGLQLDREGNENGVPITKVVKGSIAESAGIEVGDVVVSVDGDAISKRRELIRRVRRDFGKTINLKILRAENEIDFQIELKNPE